MGDADAPNRAGHGSSTMADEPDGVGRTGERVVDIRGLRVALEAARWPIAVPGMTS